MEQPYFTPNGKESRSYSLPHFLIDVLATKIAELQFGSLFSHAAAIAEAVQELRLSGIRMGAAIPSEPEMFALDGRPWLTAHPCYRTVATCLFSATRRFNSARSIRMRRPSLMLGSLPILTQ